MRLACLVSVLSVFVGCAVRPAATELTVDVCVYGASAAGVVADSDPQSEWQETRHKARAILKAAELAASEAP